MQISESEINVQTVMMVYHAVRDLVRRRSRVTVEVIARETSMSEELVVESLTILREVLDRESRGL